MSEAKVRHTLTFQQMPNCTALCAEMCNHPRYLPWSWSSLAEITISLLPSSISIKNFQVQFKHHFLLSRALLQTPFVPNCLTKLYPRFEDCSGKEWTPVLTPRPVLVLPFVQVAQHPCSQSSLQKLTINLKYPSKYVPVWSDSILQQALTERSGCKEVCERNVKLSKYPSVT